MDRCSKCRRIVYDHELDEFGVCIYCRGVIDYVQKDTGICLQEDEGPWI